ncbi:carbamoyltransferase HypF [Malaciobacter mytili]|uniref:Carbamoyltransferase n=1 Tax=Malaciobacter mytili LMG 24559 TaxID=1032238 RepID=A0AAX2AIH6_9BACT|nr:carbamoyltransferase HypF [Malaciobacter mytili]AXH14805.1 [Ni-Fe] hydrogenase maturation protein HypF [Malaciobacter mytili LMG 24559]RXK16824.1 carbamoyltransferase HypF [Malaciobacter mytili LMG 24559]
MVKSVLVKVKGIVQGVGFRPYVYNLCISLNLFGWVNNDEEGVNIALEAKESLIEEFLNTLKNSPPPLAKIDSIKILPKEFEDFKCFEIRQSENNFNKSTIISPDMAICQDCINDINDKTNPRYNYALTNCTNCGPRYSIINTVPYDRVNTSMSKFELCSFCKEEYINPQNRRYHAQPVCCEKCGPKIELFNNKNKKLKENYTAIEELAKLINQGEIVAIKGIGGFHLVCDATNDKAVLQLRKRKNRPSKPYAVMFKDILQVEKFANLNLKEKETILSKEKPITLVNKKQNSILSSFVAPNIDRLGCFIAYTPLHILLFRNLKNPIIATSANLKDEPIIRSKEELIEKLGMVVDYILDFNREIINAIDDSVVQIVDNKPLKLRNARGYAPTSIKLEKVQNKKILALGANQKSTIAIAFEDNLVLSAHIGDLNSINSVEYFIRTIDTFKRFYDFKPEILVCDKHPSYESTKWALAQKDIKLIQIQHHYAHILSTMAEYKLKKEVLGICFDGTGYGDDGNIWGGEIFIASQKEYKRVHHFKYFKLLGGEIAVKEPKRIALSLLFESFTLEEVLNLSHPLIKQFSINEIKMFYTIWQKNLNAPLTSSLGRIFDAIASFANLMHIQTYEGETGLYIEKYYNKNITEVYSYKIENEDIDISLMIKELLKDTEVEYICSKFINTLVEIILDISNKYKDLPLVLTGGVFQNKTLLEKLIYKLKEEKKEFYYSKEIPLNDAGIAIGQLYSQLL